MAAGKSDFDLHQDVAEGLDLIAVGEEMLPSYNIPTFLSECSDAKKKWPETLLILRLLLLQYFFLGYISERSIVAFFIRAVHMSTQTKAEVDVLMQRVRATGSKPWVASGEARFLVAQYACLGASQPRLPPSLHR